MYEKCELNSTTLIVRGRKNYEERYGVAITAEGKHKFYAALEFNINKYTGKQQVKLIANTEAVEPYLMVLSGSAQSGRKPYDFRCTLANHSNTSLFQSLYAYVKEEDLELDPCPDLYLTVTKRRVQTHRKPRIGITRRKGRKDRF